MCSFASVINVLLKGSDPTEPREERTQGGSRVMVGAGVSPTGGGRAGAPFSHNLPVYICVFKDCDGRASAAAAVTRRTVQVGSYFRPEPMGPGSHLQLWRLGMGSVVSERRRKHVWRSILFSYFKYPIAEVLCLCALRVLCI